MSGALAVAEPTGRPVVLVTGMSGAGISTALNALEDLGYDAVDNLPIDLVPVLIAEGAAGGRPLAIAIDSRNRAFSAEALLACSESLKARPELQVRLVFVEADDEVLQRRFTETRRRHPLVVDRPVPDGIRRERGLLWSVREQADQVIDTTALSINDLRRVMGGHFALESAAPLFIFVTSFSFRRGLPREADLVFDVRFLKNPHWVEELRPLTGLDSRVAAAVRDDPGYEPFFQGLTGLLAPLLPRYDQEGKSYLTIAIGCTGGRHRSVFVAEQLAAWLRGQGQRVGLHHRDLPPA